MENQNLIDTKFFSLGLGLGKKRVAPDALVNESLDLFTKAEQKMTEAQNEIQRQIDEDAAKVAELNENIQSANNAFLKLANVKAKLAALIS